MQEIVLVLAGHAFTAAELLSAAGLLALVLLAAVLVSIISAGRHRAAEAAAALERAREMDDRFAELTRLQSELAGRVQTVTEVFGSGQGEMARLIGDRLDSVRSAMSAGLAEGAQRTAESLGRLNERLAVIDAAQADLKGLTSEVLTLKDVLSNRPARGAFGQGRMEAIIRDGLPASAYQFQPTLRSGARPDCLVHLPGDERALAIDAKFPLEGFAALRDAQDEAARLAAERRVRADMGVHVKDVAGKYIIPGETQDFALLFVPSEALYAELCDRFEDVVTRAHKARVLVVSPSLLMMAVQVCLAIVRDARMRDQARLIQTEIGRIVEDIRRLRERAVKLETHFRQAQEDVSGVMLSAEKVARRGERIEALDLEEPASTQQNLPLRSATG